MQIKKKSLVDFTVDDLYDERPFIETGTPNRSEAEFRIELRFISLWLNEHVHFRFQTQDKVNN